MHLGDHAPAAVPAARTHARLREDRDSLHELLLGTDPIKKHIQEHSRVAQIIGTALEDGMRTLKQDGIEKVLQGITDIKQVRAVCIK